MSQPIFQKAVKSKSKLRAAFFGPSGGGKTMSALRVATGLANGGKIAVIDTEHGSASKYADRFQFDVVDLDVPTIDNMVELLSIAGEEGYSVVIIDSMTHSWQELLEEIDKLAKVKYGGNTWSAWSDGTPKQKRLVKAIVSAPYHIIATMRAKTEWTTEKSDNGKNKPVRVGLAPEEGKGIEYEFDLLMQLSPEHIAEVIKDRTGKFQDRLIDKPDEKIGAEMLAWLSEGAADAPKQSAAAAIADRKAGLPEIPEAAKAHFRNMKMSVSDVRKAIAPYIVNGVLDGEKLVQSIMAQ